MTKYIVDTNVLLDNPEFISTVENTDIIIPYGVIKELDSKKYEPGTLGLASRTVSRFLDQLRTEGSFSEGVSTPRGSRIFIIVGQDLPVDDQIVQMALDLMEHGVPCVVVSNDTNVRIKAALHGIPAEANRQLNVKPVYSTIPTYHVSEELLNKLYSEGCLDVQDGWEPIVNGYMILKSDIREASAVVCFDGFDLNRVKIPDGIFGIKHKNVEQMCALHALLNRELPLVVMTGLAGSGKTLLAVAAALHETVEKKAYEKIIVIRSPTPVGKDVGYMPGSLQEKMLVWAGSIYDNFEVLMRGHTKKNFEMFLENGTIEILPPTFLRGRSLDKTFVILDEAQSLSRHEIKTIATRIGEGSKLVVTGDLEQIDNPRASVYDNGLSILKEAFVNTDWAASIDLQKTERSDFAAAAAERL